MKRNDAMKSGFIALAAFLLLQIPIIVTNIPFFTYRVRSEPGTASALVHNGHVDYFSYLAFIREAKDGAWKVPGLYTSEPTESSFIYTFYVAAGKAAALFGMKPAFAYHAARLVSVEAFAASLVLLVAELVPVGMILPSVIVGIAATTPLQMFGRRVWEYSDAWRWWYNLDPLFRFDFVPHHHMGIAMAFLGIYCFLRFLINRKPRTLVGAASFTFLSALIYPTPVLLLITGMPLAVFWESVVRFVHTRKIQFLPLIASAIVVIAGASAVFILKRETQLGFPWSQWAAWDILHWNRYPNFIRDFAAGGGLALLLSLPAVVPAVLGKSGIKGKFLVVWAFLPYALLPFSDILGLAKIRMVFLVNFVPLGILAAITVNTLLSPVKNAHLRVILLLLFISAYLAVSLETTRIYYRDKMGFNGYQAMHIRPPVPVLDAFRHLSQYAGRHEVVLSESEAGIMLPAYAPVVSYFGHPVHTKDYEAKAYTVARFYRGQLTKEEAQTFITNANIRYIFLGPQEISEGGNITDYGLPLEEWYKSEGVTVYKVLKPQTMQPGFRNL